jgi:hypothetical protein
MRLSVVGALLICGAVLLVGMLTAQAMAESPDDAPLDHWLGLYGPRAAMSGAANAPHVVYIHPCPAGTVGRFPNCRMAVPPAFRFGRR